MRQTSTRLLVLGAVLLAIPAAARAQTDASGVDVAVSAGVGGFVEPDAPLTVTVTVTADLLFSGTIAVESGQTEVRVPAEVPAGSTKSFTVTTAPVVSGGSLRVTLLSGDEQVARRTVSFRSPGDLLVVGVLGDERIVGAVDRIRTAIADRQVQAFTLDSQDSPLGAIDYLVVSGSTPIADHTVDWLRGGGRMVLVGGDVEGLDVTPLGSLFDATWYRLGRGEVLAVDRFDTADWSSLLRPYRYLSPVTDVWATTERSLAQAASNPGEVSTPALPRSGMAIAVVLYTAVVGPLNLIVLRRLRRREWAWVTIPAISLLAVGAFWVAGRQRLSAVQMTHATVAVVEATGVDARTTLVLAAGHAGDYRVGLPDGWAGYPTALGDAGFGRGFAGDVPVPLGGIGANFGTAATIDAGALRFELPQLGYAGVFAAHRDVEVPVLDAGPGGVSLDNVTSEPVRLWGLAGSGVGPTSFGSLEPGEEGSTRSVSSASGMTMGFSLGDQMMQAANLWQDPAANQVLYPLGDAAAYLAGLERPYVFAWIQNSPITVRLDGVERRVSGPLLVLYPLDGLVDIHRARATLVSVGPNGFAQGGAPGMEFVSTDEMTVRFALADVTASTVDLGVSSEFGPIPSQFEMWDWVAGEFTEVARNGIDLHRFRSPSGDVYLRVSPGEDPGAPFTDFGMSPAALQLVWSSS